jgi:chaperonin GroEL (HSP60 family)
MTGKGAEATKEVLANVTVDAIISIADEDNNVDMDNIKVEKKVGARIEESKLIEGMIIDKERVHTNMPKKVNDAKILLVNTAIELKDTEVDAEISITSPEQLQSFLDQEEQMIKKLVDKVVASGANVVFCQKGIDDMAQHYLAKAGIFAVRRVKKSDMQKLARATSAKLVTNVDEITAEDLGKAELVEEKKIGGDEMTFVTGCENPKAVSILLRGGTEHVIDNIERALNDALRVVGVAIEDEKLVAGGGSPEVEVALRLQEYASTLSGREQLAVKGFAEALEIVPRTLAENAGLDPIDMLMELRAHHEKGVKTAGLNVYTGEVIDMWEAGVVEPLRVKTQAVNAAAESAVMILRIDDIIASKQGPAGPSAEDMVPGMPPGGMPGMDMM